MAARLEVRNLAMSTVNRSSLAKVRCTRRLFAIGLVLLLVLIGFGIGLRGAGSWRQWSRQAPQENVQDHWEQANRASENGDVALAKMHLETILAICPLNARALFLMARTCRRSNDPAGWQYIFLAESLGWPRDQIILEERLGQAEAGDIWSVEEALLDKLNRLPPEERVILEALVKGYLNSVRFLDAAEIATTWIRRYPRDWQAYLYRGRAYQGLGQLREATWDYQDVLEIRPDSTAATLWCADAFLSLNDYQNALENYQAYRNMAPDDWEPLFAIALCQFSLGQPGARATLENLLNEHPQHRDGLLLAARIDLAEDAPGKALPYLRKAMELGAPEPDVLQTLIAVLRKLDRHQEAVQVEKQYRQILEKAKQLRELNEEIQSQRGDASLRYQAGMLALELGHEKEASDWFQTVFFIDPGHRPTHLALADYWAKHGQPQRAAYHLRRAEGKRR